MLGELKRQRADGEAGLCEDTNRSWIESIRIRLMTSNTVSVKHAHELDRRTRSQTTMSSSLTANKETRRSSGIHSCFGGAGIRRTLTRSFAL